MIASESVQVGDILAIFSTDTHQYRGTVVVREKFEDPPAIAFTTPLPPGTTQGDILCLIRRRDEVRVLQAQGMVINPTENFRAPNGALYVPVDYNLVQQQAREIIELKALNESRVRMLEQSRVRLGEQ